MENSKKGAFAALGLNIDQEGLTKREYFAAMAMQGLLSIFNENEQNSIVPNEDNIVYMAKLSVKAADELLKQLEQ